MTLVEYEDYTFTAGKVGMTVGTRDRPGHEVKFTRFAVYEMEQ
jgi:hypothetical protein